MNQASEAAAGFFRPGLPLVVVVLVSIIIGLVMVVVFRYTSDQKAIHVAKDQLKAHLLAVRLFQDQLPVVLSSYGRIVLGTGRYLKLAFLPLLYAIVPLTLLMAQIDRYLGSTPLQPGESFLVTMRAADSGTVNQAALQLPAQMATTAPPVHIPAENEVVWRVVAAQDGDYDVGVAAAGQTFSKRTIVSTGLPRLSPIRLRGRFWERIFVSGESALPPGSPIQSIAVGYPDRSISFAWIQWNWIWLFFVLSLVAGFFFKSVLGIEI
jgi:type II secretory pathway pseudopilin PulG